MQWDKISRGIASLVIGSLAAGASASTVDITWVSTSPSMDEVVSTNSGSTFTTQKTGQFNFTVANKTGTAGAVIPGSTLASWCVELAQDAGINPVTYTVEGPTPISAPYVAPFANTANVTAFFNQFYSTSFNTTQITAFQLDIWELELDGTPGSLSSGTFQVAGSDAAVTQGNVWLSAFNSSTAGPWELFELHNDNFQDQIFPVEQGGGTPNPTPLPRSAFGGMLILAGAAMLKLVRRVRAA